MRTDVTEVDAGSAAGGATPHPADSHDLIRVHGARENNLKDVSVELPKRRLTVFTGVSGSGKSSLVFGTVAAESQRMINETYSTFVQGFMPTLNRPDVDVLDGLTTAIVVDQERLGANPRSTVGTVTDANAMLRIVFSRLGTPHIGSAQAFSFNVASISGAGAVTSRRPARRSRSGAASPSPAGMCPRCEGMGQVNDIDLTQLSTRRSRCPRAPSPSPATPRTAGSGASSERSCPSTSRSAASPRSSGRSSCYGEPARSRSRAST
jgi:excinuclease UvrABC ATPase subunit